MKRLILAGWGGGSELARSGLAEIVIPFHFQFAWGALPRAEKLSAYFAAYTTDLGPADHWSDWVRWPRGAKGRELSLVEFCEPYDTIELWFAATARDQLQLVWLLDHLGNCPALAQKLALRLLDYDPMFSPDYDFAKAEPHIPVADVGAEEFEIAKLAWSAYRAPTPEACIDLLHRDLSALLMLRPALLELLAELPSPLTGLGATEMRFLDMLAWYANTNALFHLRSLRDTYVFGEVELGYLLEGLAPRSEASCVRAGQRITYHRPWQSRSPAQGLSPQSAVVDRIRKGCPGASGRFQPPQSDRSLVGWHPPDQ